MKKRNLKYTEEELIFAIKKFVEEFKRVPISRDFEKLKEYPSRKTFEKYFGSINNAVKKAGFEPVGFNKKENFEKYYNKEYLLKIIFDYYNNFNIVPTLKEMNSFIGKEVKIYYKKYLAHGIMPY